MVARQTHARLQQFEPDFAAEAGAAIDFLGVASCPLKNLGRKEVVVASGELDGLAASVARYAERAVVLSQLAAGNPDGLACKRIGAPLLFGRLWEETGCRAVIEDCSPRSFELPGTAPARSGWPTMISPA